MNLWRHLRPQTWKKRKSGRRKKQWVYPKTCRKIYKHVRKIHST